MSIPFAEKIDPAHTAVIVIDVQRDFAAADGVRGKSGSDLSLVDPMVDGLLRFIPAAERVGVPVLYTQQIYNPDQLNDMQREQFVRDGRQVMCDPATGGHLFYRLQPPVENVFEKQTFSIFFNEYFCYTLTDRGIKTLIITGMSTYYCVEMAVRHGFDLGYRIVVLEDLVAGNGKCLDLHHRTLDLVRRTFGVVAHSSDVLALWSDIPSSS